MDVYGVIGNPVGHSLSPLMHQAALDALGIPARYVAFCVQNLTAAVQGIRGLNLRGVSVTLPFKTEVMDLLDGVEAGARAIGAVNTIVNDHGRLTGFNTDGTGLIRDLREVMDIEGRRFAVLGAGGAARAAVFGLVQAGGIPVVLNRTARKGEALAADFGCTFRPLAEAAGVEADCLINTTPVGMAPGDDRSPLPADVPGRFPWVVDIVYTPLRTRFLREAAAAGCRTRSGLGMFIHQGAEQLRIWTGRTAPVDLMRRVVEARLIKAG